MGEFGLETRSLGCILNLCQNNCLDEFCIFQTLSQNLVHGLENNFYMMEVDLTLTYFSI